jgi:hypothetical protein
MHSLKTILSKIYTVPVQFARIPFSGSVNTVIGYTDYEKYRNIVRGILKQSVTLTSEFCVIEVVELYEELKKNLNSSLDHPLPHDRILDKYLVPKLCNELNLKLYKISVKDTKINFNILTPEQ